MARSKRTPLGRWAGRASMAGVLVLAGGVTVALLGPWGQYESTTSTPDGRTTTVVTTTSLWSDQHKAAVGVLIGAIVFGLGAVALTRWGGVVGRGLVVATGGLIAVATILSVGPLVMPGVALLCLGAVLTEADRQEQRRLRRLPAPPPPVPAPA